MKWYKRTDGYGIFQLLILPQLIDAIAKGKRENRECVYQFVAPDDERDSIFGQWLNRDELFLSESVSVSNNISTTTPVTDTTSLSISHNTEVVSGTNNIVFATPLSDMTPHTPENIAILGWKGLMVKMQLGLNSAGDFYSELASQVGEAVGVADGEPYWNAYLGQWQIWVNFADECRSVVCDWLVGGGWLIWLGVCCG